MKKVLRAAICAALVFMGCAPSAFSQDRVTLGFARLFTNDALGDMHDRWRSGSYAVSRFRGYRWDGQLPSEVGSMLEARIRSEIIAPRSLTNRAIDRPYVGVIAPGLFTHFDVGGFEARLGGELVFTGPQTKVGAFQREVHEFLGLDTPPVLGSQIPDGVHPTANLEIGKDLTLGSAVVRPFLEAQVGVEDYLRVGADVILGRFGRDGLFTRDTVTGHRVLGISALPEQGISLTLGGDVARVFDSVYLPDFGPATLKGDRARLRAGVHWQGERAAVFYGVTWLGKEFEEQATDQILCSVRLSLQF